MKTLVADVQKWLLEDYSRPLAKDAWFVVAAGLVIVSQVWSILVQSWLGVITSLFILVLVGGVRRLWSAFLGGYRGAPDGG